MTGRLLDQCYPAEFLRNILTATSHVRIISVGDTCCHLGNYTCQSAMIAHQKAWDGRTRRLIAINIPLERFIWSQFCLIRHRRWLDRILCLPCFNIHRSSLGLNGILPAIFCRARHCEVTQETRSRRQRKNQRWEECIYGYQHPCSADGVHVAIDPR